ncbi:MAG: hypothetical protein DRG20_03615 [Deltaproteobacteria bacterium]|nr:MAG: hypothetical protein DRG20_03615 [Deltaproteobacteria bacterium]
MALSLFTANNIFKFKTKKEVFIEKIERIPVAVEPIKFREFKWVIERMGEVQPLFKVDVFPKIPGKIIEKILVEKGDYVKKGELLATLEEESIMAKIKEANAALYMAIANRNVLVKDYKRLKSLFKEKAIPKQKLDHVEAQLKAAYAQVRRAKAILNQLEILKSEHKILAPISGYISARFLDQGSITSTSHPIFSISHEETEKIVTTITEKEYPKIKKGMKVEIGADAVPGKIFYGEVSLISPTINPATRTAEIEIHILNKDLLLKSGMYVTTRIYLGKKRALAVRRDALNRLPGTGNYYVFVVKNQKAVLKNVKIGISDENYIEIVQGLKEGEKVVIKGQNRLKDGTPVIITDAYGQKLSRGKMK